MSRSKIMMSLFSVSLLLAACGGGSSTSSSSSSGISDSSSVTTIVSSSSSDSSSAASSSEASVVSTACNEETQHIAQVVCMAEAFEATLSSTQLQTLQYDWSDSKAKTTWSNFPTDMTARNGLQFATLSSTSLAAAKAFAATVLSDSGYSDFIGALAADDYLKANGGGTAYGSGKYYIAFIGTPAVNGSWSVQIGGHHLAYNITYLSGVGYPVPNHLGMEPKASFELNSATYQPLKDEGDALVAMFNGLSSTELDYAYLSQSFGDVLVGPDNGSGVLPDDYPTGSNRTGKLVSDLSSEQQALVTAAIETWVRDYPPAVADALLAEYTSAAAYADTYIAWAGTKAKGVDVDTSGTYMRIDGPRLWIEVACQNGVIIRDKTHYHTIFRDKTMDYGDSL